MYQIGVLLGKTVQAVGAVVEWLCADRCACCGEMLPIDGFLRPALSNIMIADLARDASL